MDKEMVKVTFLLPIRDNEGNSLGDLIEELEKKLYAEFGGLTKFPGHAMGKYTYRMKDGNYGTEACLMYFVAMPEEHIPKIKSLLETFKLKAKQESIYCEIQKNSEVLFL